MKDVLNNVAAQYWGRISAIRDHLAVIETQLKTVSDLIRQGDHEDVLRKAADELSDNMKKIEHSLSEIRT